MHRFAPSFCLLLATTGSFFLLVTQARQQPHPSASDHACVPHERDALLAFKQGITNDTEGSLASWRRGHDWCSWAGVKCDNRTGHVVELDLFGAGLEGQISPSLLSLEHLEYLDLSENDLRGKNGSFPVFLCSFNSLRHLSLSNMDFTSAMPPQLGNLSKLEYLDLSDTVFLPGAAVPPQLGNLSNLQYLDLFGMRNMYSTDISWLTHLHTLEYIDMGCINLSTIVDLPLVANMIPTLKVLRFFNCSLPSVNQSLAHLNLTKLEVLYLSKNYFGHSIASSWFWNVTSIKFLWLDSTYLHGPFPDALGRMVSLQALGFSYNGNAATMAVDLKNLCELENLYLEGSLSSGNITEFLEKMPRCSSGQMSTILALPDSNMTGMLPNFMDHLSSINILDLSNNSISGSIPLGFWKFTSLDELYLDSNNLSGQIPLLPASLEVLILSSNYFSGHIPESICELPNMLFLDLSNNFIEGSVPRCSWMPNLQVLQLSNNRLFVEFPWLRSFSSLNFLDLSRNKFYGTLPAWIGELKNISFLHLNHNMFHGNIPVSITNLRQLQYLNLAANSISGLIPLSLSNLVGMSLNHRTGPGADWTHDVPPDFLTLVTKHEELKYGEARILYMVGIDLSLNHLTGAIPDEITSLDRLSNLNLSWNHLSGEIPEKIGSMKLVESLDLSRNNFSSEIPPSLSDLTYLSSLDLSYNNLTGRIPQGRQLDTIYAENPSIYDGNSGLCGPPLQRNCSGSNPPETGIPVTSDEKDSEQMFLYFGLGSGFMVGLWVVFCALLFKKTWRIAYFRIFDRTCDKVYVFLVVTWSNLAREASTD